MRNLTCGASKPSYLDQTEPRSYIGQKKRQWIQATRTWNRSNYIYEQTLAHPLPPPTQPETLHVQRLASFVQFYISLALLFSVISCKAGSIEETNLFYREFYQVQFEKPEKLFQLFLKPKCYYKSNNQINNSEISIKFQLTLQHNCFLEICRFINGKLDIANQFTMGQGGGGCKICVKEVCNFFYLNSFHICDSKVLPCLMWK